MNIGPQPSFTRCWSGNYSYPAALSCDGIKHCPQGEDEQFCHGTFNFV